VFEILLLFGGHGSIRLLCSDAAMRMLSAVICGVFLIFRYV